MKRNDDGADDVHHDDGIGSDWDGSNKMMIS